MKKTEAITFNTPKKRIRWIDTARGICVFCVLLAHCKQDLQFLQYIFTPFYLALFFFISGYLYKCKTLKEDIFKLVKSLIIPYFLLCIVQILIGVDNWHAVLSGNYPFFIDKVKSVLLGYHMWFVPCIIMVQLYYILLYHLFMRNLVSKMIVCLLSLSSIYLIDKPEFVPHFFCYDTAIFALAYFVAGNIVKEVAEKYRGGEKNTYLSANYPA